MGIELPVSGVAAAFGEMHAYPPPHAFCESVILPQGYFDSVSPSTFKVTPEEEVLFKMQSLSAGTNQEAGLGGVLSMSQASVVSALFIQ